MRLLLLTQDKTKFFDESMASTIQSNQGNTCVRILGKQYYRLKCIVSNNNYHQKLIGGIKNSQQRGIYNINDFMKDYNQKNGFSIKFDGEADDFVMPLIWNDIVNLPLEIMFFGPPTNGTHQFDDVFQKRTSSNTLHHIFRSFFYELAGDMIATLALFNSQNKENDT